MARNLHHLNPLLVRRGVRDAFSLAEIFLKVGWQSLATILFGMIAFLYAFRAWMDTAQLPVEAPTSGEIEVILIHSGEAKVVVLMELRRLASLVAKTDY